MSYNGVAPVGGETAAETLVSAKNRISVTIRDDGDGFDADATLKRSWQDRGLGLAGIRERAMLLNGVFALASQPTRGTTITVSVPLEPAARPLALAQLAARSHPTLEAARLTPPILLDSSGAERL
jgi:signal transduction histidine kinase